MRPATESQRNFLDFHRNAVCSKRLADGHPASMDINKMLAELRAERDQLDEAILLFERPAAGRGRRRGRPPKWMTQVKRRGRPPGSKNKRKD